MFEEINNQRGISYCYQSLCNSFTELRQYEPALVYAKKSLEIKTGLNDRRGLGSAQSGLGDIYFGKGNLEKVIYHYTIGLDLAKEQKNLADEQGAYLKLAKVYSAKKMINRRLPISPKAGRLQNCSMIALQLPLLMWN